MKLELKHLAPYLPYGLKSIDYFDGHKLIRDVTLFNAANFFNQTTNAKILLHPLSDLTKEKYRNLIHEKFYMSHRRHGIKIIREMQRNVMGLKYEYVVFLLENHFDIFGLIPNNLAIDINTLNTDKK